MKETETIDKVTFLLSNYKKFVVFEVCDKFPTNELHALRRDLEKIGCFTLKAKNYCVRKAIFESQRGLKLIPYIKGNLLFGALDESVEYSILIDKLQQHSASAFYNSMDVCIADLYTPTGITNLNPTQTSFFPALNIATKISRGQIEILNSVMVAKKGEQVSPSAASLLRSLGIKYTINNKLKCILDDNDFIILPDIAYKLVTNTVTNTLTKALFRICSISFATNSISPSLSSLFSQYFPNKNDLEFFQLNGYWTSSHIINPSRIQKAKQKISEMLKGAVDMQNRIINASKLDEDIRDIVHDPIIAQIAAKFLNIEDYRNLRIWSDEVLEKPPNQTGNDFGWHQDYEFWQCTSPTLITAWIPLIDTSETNGCMHYIPGKHNELIKINVENQVSVAMQVGQVSFHHCLTVHGSGPNRSEMPRTAIVVHFIQKNAPYIKNSSCENHFNVQNLKEKNLNATTFENL